MPDEPESPDLLDRVLAQLGFKTESVQKFRFGGIVGKVALIALGGFAAAIGTAKYTTGPIQIVCVIGVLATTVLIVRWVLDYAHKHPASATLEGAEMILWQQQQIVLAAQGVTPPKDARLIASPLAIESKEDEHGG